MSHVPAPRVPRPGVPASYVPPSLRPTSPRPRVPRPGVPESSRPKSHVPVPLLVTALKNRTLENRKGEMEDLTTTELKDAENLWIQSVQALSFTDELSFLTRKDSKSTPPIRVPQLGLFLDDDAGNYQMQRTDHKCFPIGFCKNPDTFACQTRLHQSHY